MRTARSLSVAVASLVAASPAASAQFAADQLYLTDYNLSDVYHVDPLTWTATKFVKLPSQPTALVASPAGTLYATTVFPQEIVEIASDGSKTVLWDAADGVPQVFGPNALAFAPNGDLYVATYYGRSVRVFPADGSASYLFADATDGLFWTNSVAFDRSGNLFVTEEGSWNVWRFDPAGNGVLFDTFSGAALPGLACRGEDELFASTRDAKLYRWTGGEKARRELFLDLSGALGVNSGYSSLQFDRISAKLYLTHSKVDGVVEIDPDTGAWQLVAAGQFGTGAAPYAVAVTGERCGPSFRPYFTGVAGTGGIVPTLSASGSATLGGTVTLELRDFVGGTTGLIALAMNPASDRLFKGDLGVYLDAATILIGVTLNGPTGAAGAGTLDWSDVVPNDPAFECAHVYAQAFMIDPAAPIGVSTSNALDVFIGH